MSNEDLVKELIKFIGDNPEREGLQETPRRFLKAWKEYWGVGYYESRKPNLKVFKDGFIPDQMIVIKDVTIFSHCEHHIAPFFGKAHIAYIPGEAIVGLSKINRLAQWISRKLQVQERITAQIADELEATLKPKGVAVLLNCNHTCVCSRGVEDTNSTTITTDLRGVFKTNSEAKKEFFDSIKL